MLHPIIFLRIPYVTGILDAPRGFEPRLTESESVVLPLDDRAMAGASKWRVSLGQPRSDASPCDVFPSHVRRCYQYSTFPMLRVARPLPPTMDLLAQPRECPAFGAEEAAVKIVAN